MKKTIVGIIVVFLMVISLPIVNIEAETNRQEDYFSLIDEVIEAETRFGLSGAQLAVMHGGEMVYTKGYGYKNNFRNVINDGVVDLEEYQVIPMDERVPVTTDTLFDLASNTKMYATNYAIQLLVEEGKIALDTKVQNIFPEFKYRGYGEDFQSEVTIEDLLMHKAGFMSDPRYHDDLSSVNDEYFEDQPGFEEGVNPLYSGDRETTKQKVLETQLIYERGTKHMYSDADFMLLGFIIEEVTGKQLDVYLNETIYEPLGLSNVMFNPMDHGVSKDRIVASEVHGTTRGGFFQDETEYANIRKTVVDGEVHDEKAYYSMGGISGHAGLFGNAEDIVKLASEMLPDRSQLFAKSTIDQFTGGSELNDTYGVGWRRQGEANGYSWAFSPYASNQTIGHTGWTGTLTLIDPVKDVVISLNTNSRNTPMMTDENTFFTTNFNTNTYGTISTLVYEALDLGSSKTADESLIDLFENERPDDYAGVTISKRNVVRALISAIESKSNESEVLKDYMDNEQFQSTLLALEENNNDDFKILSNPESYRIGHVRLENLYDETKDTENIYTDSTWTIFTESLTNASNLLKDDLASQNDVNKAYEDLNEAYNNLEEKSEDIIPVDTKDLEAILKQAKTIKPKEYTESTYKAIEDLIKEAEVLLNQLKDDETSVTQEEVNALTLQLETAIKNLEEVKVPSKPDQDNNDNSTKDNQEESKDPLPSTGQSPLNTKTLFGFELLSTGALYTFFVRKRKNK